MQLTWTALLLALTLVLSGCADDGAAADDIESDGTDEGGRQPDEGGSEEGDEEAGNEDEDAGEEEAEPEKRDSVMWTIDIEGNDFVDGSLTIQAGDTIRWINRDPVAHTVTAEDGSFDSNTMSRALNQEFDWTFEEVGEFPYLCEFHTSMTDTITVLAVYEGTPD